MPRPVPKYLGLGPAFKVRRGTTNRKPSALAIRRMECLAESKGNHQYHHRTDESERAENSFLVPAQKEELRPILDVQLNQWPEILLSCF
jgi:hypothetical protein